LYFFLAWLERDRASQHIKQLQQSEKLNEDRRSLLQKDEELRELHRVLVGEQKILTDDEFWNSRRVRNTHTHNTYTHERERKKEKKETNNKTKQTKRTKQKKQKKNKHKTNTKQTNTAITAKRSAKIQ